jgi:hypothetical protein
MSNLDENEMGQLGYVSAELWQYVRKERDEKIAHNTILRMENKALREQVKTLELILKAKGVQS